MSKRKPYYFAISEDQLTENSDFSTRGLLDMLRYDAATVVEHYRGFWILSRPENPPTVGRWASFRLTPLGGDYGSFREIFEMRQRIDEHLGVKP